MTHKWEKDALEVVDKMTKEEKNRLRVIKAMHTMVVNMNDEGAYMTWIYLVPDGATAWDFIDFATNDPGTTENKYFDEAVVLFKKLWERYAKQENGLFVGGKCY